MEIKPCPFCGFPGEIQWGYFAYQAYCTNEKCGCVFMNIDGMTEEEAIQVWNNRKPPSIK